MIVQKIEVAFWSRLSLAGDRAYVEVGHSCRMQRGLTSDPPPSLDEWIDVIEEARDSDAPLSSATPSIVVAPPVAPTPGGDVTAVEPVPDEDCPGDIVAMLIELGRRDSAGTG